MISQNATILVSKLSSQEKYKKQSKIFQTDIFKNNYEFKKLIFSLIFSLIVNSLAIIMIFINPYKITQTHDITNKFNFPKIKYELLLMETFLLFIGFLLLIMTYVINYYFPRFKKYISYSDSFYCGFNNFFQCQVYDAISDYCGYLFLRIYLINYLKTGITFIWIYKFENNYIINLLSYITYILSSYFNHILYEFDEINKYSIILMNFSVVISFSLVTKKNFEKNFFKIKNLYAIKRGYIDFLNNLDYPVVIFKQNAKMFYNDKFKDQTKSSLSSGIREMDEVFLKVSVFSNLENFSQDFNKDIIDAIKEFQKILGELNIFFLNEKISEITKEQKLCLNNLVQELLEYIFNNFNSSKYAFIGTRVPFSFYSLKNNLLSQKVFMRINPSNECIEIILKSHNSTLTCDEQRDNHSNNGSTESKNNNKSDNIDLKNSEKFLHKVFSNILRKISHEFRNPLLNIIEITKNIKRNMNFRDKYLVGEKINSIKYLCYMMNFNITDFEYLNTTLNKNNFSDLIEYFRDKVKNNDLEYDIRKEFKFLKNIFDNKLNLTNKRININLNIDSDIPQKIKLNYAMINHMIFVIISNSVKFSLKGNVEIKSFQIKKSDNLTIIISDEGVGIKEEFMDKIGQQFYKPNNSTNSFGLGMGLFNARIIAEALSGVLLIESRFGIGTTVTIQIPFLHKSSKDYRLLLNNFTIKSEKFKQSEKTFSSLSNISKHIKTWGTTRSINKSKVILTSSKNYSLHNGESFCCLSERKKSISVSNLMKKNFSLKTKLSHKKSQLYRNTLESLSKMTSGLTNKEDLFLAINYRDILKKKSFCVNCEKNEFFYESGLINIYNINLNNSSSINLKSINLKSININSNVYNHNPNTFFSSNLSNNNISYSNNHFQQIVQQEKTFLTNKIIWRILVVDDEDFIRQSQINIINKFFKKNNFQIQPEFDQCSDGIECLYKIYDNLKLDKKYDIILTDETMNFMKGSQMSKIIKNFIKENILYDVKIAMITSYDKSILEKTGYSDYIDYITTKPLSINVVEDIFYKLIN